MLALLFACWTPATDKGSATDSATDTAAETDTAEWRECDEDADGFCPSDGDCNDEDADVWPGAPEACNESDDDCDREIDEDAGGTYYADSDGDGFGDPAAIQRSCEPIAGYADNGADCNDASANVFPGAEERANGSDDDCDGEVDEGASADPFTVNVTWSSTGATVVITGAESSWYFGMAETGVGEAGWYGESCVPGEEPQGMEDYGYDVCHTLGANGGFIEYVVTIDRVESGGTLFTEDIHDRGSITYVVFSPSKADCWVWGDDPSYYDDYGCTEL